MADAHDVRPRLERRESLSQRLLRQVTLAAIRPTATAPATLPAGIDDQTEAKVHVQLAPVLVQRSGGPHLVRVRVWPSIDRPAETLPVSSAQSLRNDDVEALADNLVGGEPEHGLGAAVPDPDHTVAVGEDHRVRHLLRRWPRTSAGSARMHHVLLSGAAYCASSPMPGTAKPPFTDCSSSRCSRARCSRHCLACRRQLHLHATLVASTRVAPHQAGRLASRNQRHDAVVLGLQALGELRDGRPFAAGKALDLQHQLVLQRSDAALARHLLAEPEKAAQLVAKVASASKSAFDILRVDIRD